MPCTPSGIHAAPAMHATPCHSSPSGHAPTTHIPLGMHPHHTCLLPCILPGMHAPCHTHTPTMHAHWACTPSPDMHAPTSMPPRHACPLSCTPQARMPPTTHPSAIHVPPWECTSNHVCFPHHASPHHAGPPSCMPPSCHTPPPGMHTPTMHVHPGMDPLPCMPPYHACLPPVDRITDVCENITLPQLCCGQ